MQGINLKTLIQQLFDVNETEPELPPVSDYVMQHIFKPLLADQKVCYAALDFEQFTGSDIADLETMLEERERQKDRLERLNRVFCKAEPISVRQRAFC